MSIERRPKPWEQRDKESWEAAAAELATGGTQKVLTSPEALEVSAKLEALLRDPEQVEKPKPAAAKNQPRPAAPKGGKQPADVESLCDERMARAVIDCRRKQQPLTLLLAEIDYETELDDAALATAARWLQNWLTCGMAKAPGWFVVTGTSSPPYWAMMPACSARRLR